MYRQDKGITCLRTYISVLFGNLNLRKMRTAIKQKLKLLSKYLQHYHSEYSSVCCTLFARRVEEFSNLIVTGFGNNLRLFFLIYYQCHNVICLLIWGSPWTESSNKLSLTRLHSHSESGFCLTHIKFYKTERNNRAY